MSEKERLEEQFEEVVNLAKCLGHFALAQSERLVQKVREGYRWWDRRERASDQQILWSIAEDVLTMETMGDLTLDPAQVRKLCVDIANRAMFIWHRYSPEGAHLHQEEAGWRESCGGS